MTDNKGPTGRTRFFQQAVDTLFRHWHFMRWLRLALGIFLTWQLVQKPDIFTGAVAVFFLFQAVTNTGCCGSSGCAVPEKPRQTSPEREVNFEEIK